MCVSTPRMQVYHMHAHTAVSTVPIEVRRWYWIPTSGDTDR